MNQPPYFSHVCCGERFPTQEAVSSHVPTCNRLRYSSKKLNAIAAAWSRIYFLEWFLSAETEEDIAWLHLTQDVSRLNARLTALRTHLFRVLGREVAR